MYIQYIVDMLLYIKNRWTNLSVVEAESADGREFRGKKAASLRVIIMARRTPSIASRLIV